MIFIKLFKKIYNSILNIQIVFSMLIGKVFLQIKNFAYLCIVVFMLCFTQNVARLFLEILRKGIRKMYDKCRFFILALYSKLTKVIFKVFKFLRKKYTYFILVFLEKKLGVYAIFLQIFFYILPMKFFYFLKERFLRRVFLTQPAYFSLLREGKKSVIFFVFGFFRFFSVIDLLHYVSLLFFFLFFFVLNFLLFFYHYLSLLFLMVRYRLLWGPFLFFLRVLLFFIKKVEKHDGFFFVFWLVMITRNLLFFLVFCFFVLPFLVDFFATWSIFIEGQYFSGVIIPPEGVLDQRMVPVLEIVPVDSVEAKKEAYMEYVSTNFEYGKFYVFNMLSYYLGMAMPLDLVSWVFAPKEQVSFSLFKPVRVWMYDTTPEGLEGIADFYNMLYYEGAPFFFFIFVFLLFFFLPLFGFMSLFECYFGMSQKKIMIRKFLMDIIIEVTLI